jgi:hypothetical protein
MFKQLAVVTSIAAFSFVPAKAISLPDLSEEMIAFTNQRSVENNLLPIQLKTPIFSNFNHDLYGISKSIWKKLHIDSEIDDGTENIFREYGVFFLLFGGLFGWMIFKSLSEVRRK